MILSTPLLDKSFESVDSNSLKEGTSNKQNKEKNKEVRFLRNEAVNDILDKLNLTDDKKSDINDFSIVKEENIFNKDFLKVLNSPTSKYLSECSSPEKLSFQRKTKESISLRVKEDLKIMADFKIDSPEKTVFQRKTKESISVRVKEDLKIMEEFKNRSQDNILERELINTSFTSAENYLRNNRNYIPKMDFYEKLSRLHRGLEETNGSETNESNKQVSEISQNVEVHQFPENTNTEDLNPYTIETKDMINNFNENGQQFIPQMQNNSIYNNNVSEGTNTINYNMNLNIDCQPNIYNPDWNSGFMNTPIKNCNIYQNNQMQNCSQFYQKAKGNPYCMNNSRPKPINYFELSLEEALRIYPTMCKDKFGCRSFQKRIDENPSLAMTIINLNFYNVYLDLIKDQFGNYFVQKLIEHIEVEELANFIKQIYPYIHEIGTSSHGTRVIQKIIDCLRTDFLIELFVFCIKDYIIPFSLNVNGNHIIIKFISQIRYPYTGFIYESIVYNFMSLATDKYGCVVIQKSMNVLPRDHQIKRYIIQTIAQNTKILITDMFEQNYNDVNVFITNYIVSDILTFARQKVASNVIEKILDCCNDEIKMKILSKLLIPEVLNVLLFDKFGNYGINQIILVVQKSLLVSNDYMLQQLLQVLYPFMDKLKKSSSGVKLYEKFIANYPELNVQKNKYYDGMCNKLVMSEYNANKNYDQNC